MINVASVDACELIFPAFDCYRFRDHLPVPDDFPSSQHGQEETLVRRCKWSHHRRILFMVSPLHSPSSFSSPSPPILSGLTCSGTIAKLPLKVSQITNTRDSTVKPTPRVMSQDTPLQTNNRKKQNKKPLSKKQSQP